VDVTLRPASDQDREFLYTLHCATMRDAIEQTWGWDDSWQRASFETRLAEYDVSVIEVDRRPVGSVWLEQRPDSLYVHDFGVSPSEQCRGIGSAVVGMVVEQGARRRLPIVLSVLSVNPRARALYERLGFRVTAVEPPFVRMRRDVQAAQDDA
jgi:ribosomal protein S18 acetylase RimI-like enzyme